MSHKASDAHIEYEDHSREKNLEKILTFAHAEGSTQLNTEKRRQIIKVQ